MIVAALYGEPRHVLLVLVGVVSADLLPGAVAAAPRARVLGHRGDAASASSGSAWRWLTRCCCASLRTATASLVDVLIATFLGDTGAYFGGRFYGRTPLAPLDLAQQDASRASWPAWSGGTLAFWFAGLYQDWLSGPHALADRRCVALAAPVGDLFESLIKRDLEVKDTGRFFGAHGGVLDRLDASSSPSPTAYYVAHGPSRLTPVSRG